MCATFLNHTISALHNRRLPLKYLLSNNVAYCHSITHHNGVGVLTEQICNWVCVHIYLCVCTCNSEKSTLISRCLERGVRCGSTFSDNFSAFTVACAGAVVVAAADFNVADDDEWFSVAADVIVVISVVVGGSTANKT